VRGWGEDWYFPASEVIPKAKAAVEKAPKLDDSLAEAHTSLGIILYFCNYDWAAGEREFRRAIELNPNYAYAHNQYGEFLTFQGRFDEALVEMKLATELDPLSAEITLDSRLAVSFPGKLPSCEGAVPQGVGVGSDLLLLSTRPRLD